MNVLLHRQREKHPTQVCACVCCRDETTTEQWERDLTSIILMSRDILWEAVSNALTVHWIGIISPGAGLPKPLEKQKYKGLQSYRQRRSLCCMQLAGNFLIQSSIPFKDTEVSHIRFEVETEESWHESILVVKGKKNSTRVEFCHMYSICFMFWKLIQKCWWLILQYATLSNQMLFILTMYLHLTVTCWNDLNISVVTHILKYLNWWLNSNK